MSVNYFNNLSIAKKILCLYVIMLLFLGIVGATGYSFMSTINEGAKNIYDSDLLPIQWLNIIRHNLRANEAAAKEMMLTSDSGRIAELQAGVKARTAEYDELLKRYMSMPDLEDAEKEHLEKYSKAVEEYKKERDIALAMALSGQKGEAYRHYYLKVQKPLDTAQDELKALAELNQKAAEENNANNKKSFASARVWLISIIGLAIVISLVLAIYIVRAISSPLRKMLVISQEIAGGDLREKQQTINSKDEVGQLAGALFGMRKNLHVLIKQVSEVTNQVAASSEELTANSEQSAQAANQVAGSITTIARGADEQMGAANESSAIVEQMSAGIQQMAASANQVAAQSVQAADKAQDGGEAVDKAVRQMAQIEDTVNTSARVVAKLGERSKEIGQIVDTISGIAGQTNLLALNAAIEAARAGEAGRGFAVVAEEVRKLAEQSQEAAKKIADLIGEIQGDTDKAVVAMNDGTREVKTGAEVVNAAGVTFREIVKLVSQVSGQVKEISAATQQMASGSQAIVGSVQKIDQLSKRSADEAQGVSAATEEQLASMEEIASSSEALSKLAQELQAAVAKFRV